MRTRMDLYSKQFTGYTVNNNDVAMRGKRKKKEQK